MKGGGRRRVKGEGWGMEGGAVEHQLDQLHLAYVVADELARTCRQGGKRAPKGGVLSKRSVPSSSQLSKVIFRE